MTENSEVRYEFYNGEVFAMAGGTPSHAYIADNLVVGLGPKCRAKGCRTVGSDLRVRIEESGYHTYPDLTLICGKPELASDDPNSLVNPIAIFEVLSPGTERHDRRFKLNQYRLIPSVKQVVLVAQDAMSVESYEPTEKGWFVQILTKPDERLELPIEGVSIPLSEIYEGIELPPDEGQNGLTPSAASPL